LAIAGIVHFAVRLAMHIAYIPPEVDHLVFAQADAPVGFKQCGLLPTSLRRQQISREQFIVEEFDESAQVVGPG
jgi:hypothetical protein